MRPLRIFIGYDSREPIAFHVLSHSIIRHASLPVQIIPLVQSQLRAKEIYWREPDLQASTEFSLTRFLVPYLCDYEGPALFMDCDMLMREDIYSLFGGVLFQFAVSVCKHDYVPKEQTKMDGRSQLAYPRKNWSSFMFFNTAMCRKLDLEYVNTVTPAALHRFEWAQGIGDLPFVWNWLVGEYPHNDLAKNLHYTLGGPWFGEHAHDDHADDWKRELAKLLPESYVDEMRELLPRDVPDGSVV